MQGGLVPQQASVAVEAAELKGLIQTTTSPALSIYLPMVRATVTPEQNAVHLKNALGGVEEQLRDRGMDRTGACSLLAPVRSLLDERAFWSHQQDGLALLRSPDTFERYQLPFSVRPQVVVADAPYVVPLFRSLAHGSLFHVLALSQGAVRLIQCDARGASEVDTSELGIPHSLEDALRYDDLQKPESRHPTASGPGHGDDGEDRKGQVRRYIHAVEAGISRHLGSTGAPLVLAGVDYERAMYRETTGYQAVLAKGIEGNPDHLRPAQLMDQARPVMESHWRVEMSALRDRYETALAHGGAACELDEVLWAAYDGRIETLFVEDGAEAWGMADAGERVVEASDQRGPGINELHDLAARRSLMNGGRVMTLDGDAMPCEGPIAAIYRY